MKRFHIELVVEVPEQHDASAVSRAIEAAVREQPGWDPVSMTTTRMIEKKEEGA